MGFTTSCFIRKNTTELRKKLEDLGYERNAYECFWDDENRYIITTIDSNDNAYYTLCIKDSCLLKNKEFINCETNEELFLALVSLRDDSDYMQWFISDETKQFYKCTSNKFDFHQEGIANWLCCSSAEYFRKATVEEIIEHFKK